MIFRLILSSIIIFIFSSIVFADPFEGFSECGTPDSLPGLITNLSVIDTAKVIHIFATFPEDVDSMGSDSLFTDMLSFGDTTGYGPPQIIKKSSFG